MQDSATINLSTIDPTWKIAVRVWWSWQWRTFLAGTLLSMFFNFWLGIFLPATPASAWIRPAVSVVASSLVGLFFFKDVIDREFPDFRVCVVPKHEESVTDSSPAPAVVS